MGGQSHKSQAVTGESNNWAGYNPVYGLEIGHIVKFINYQRIKCIINSKLNNISKGRINENSHARKRMDSYC